MGLIESCIIKHDGLEFAVELVADYDTKPTDFDCYSVEDIEAWRRDEWHYVGVRVYLRGLEEASSASVWGVEYGLIGEAVCDLDAIIQDTVPDLLDESRTLALDAIAKWASTLGP